MRGNGAGNLLILYGLRRNAACRERLARACKRRPRRKPPCVRGRQHQRVDSQRGRGVQRRRAGASRRAAAFLQLRRPPGQAGGRAGGGHVLHRGRRRGQQRAQPRALGRERGSERPAHNAAGRESGGGDEQRRRAALPAL